MTANRPDRNDEAGKTSRGNNGRRYRATGGRIYGVFFDARVVWE